MATALLFPGQGAQAVGMGQQVCERFPVGDEMFAEASEILGFDLKRVCVEGPAETLNRTEYSQPALFVHSMILLRELEQERPELWGTVSAVAGLSLGEYTAVSAAGGLSFADGVRLVHVRGKAMQAAADATEGGMSSILGLDQDKLDAICQQVSRDGAFARVANLLCPGNIAISGHAAVLEQAEKQSLESGAMKAVRLQVAGAFHTPLMQPAVEQLQAAFNDVSFSTTRVPVYSNVDAQGHREPEEIRSLLARQVVGTVQWEASLRQLISDGIDQFIEVGVGRVLAGTLKRIERKMPCENVTG